MGNGIQNMRSQNDCAVVGQLLLIVSGGVAGVSVVFVNWGNFVLVQTRGAFFLKNLPNHRGVVAEPRLAPVPILVNRHGCRS